MSELRTFGLNVKDLVSKLKISESQFGDLVGLSIKDVNRLFEGMLLPTPEKVKRICKVLNVKSSDIIKERNDRTPFKHKENEDMILDFIDDYICLAEFVVYANDR